MDCMVPYRSTVAQIERLDIAAARGAQVRSRSRWIEEGESSWAFFPREEKKCGVDRRISALRQGMVPSCLPLGIFVRLFSRFTLLYFRLSR